MLPADFKIEMDRLKDVFGKTHYSDEREKMIWKFVENANVYWFRGAVDFFIGESRQAPLLAQIREHFYAHQRKTEFQKSRDSGGPLDLMPQRGSKLPPEFIKEISYMINKKIMGMISDEEFGAWREIAFDIIKDCTGVDPRVEVYEKYPQLRPKKAI